MASVSTRDLWTFSTVVCLSSTLDMKTMHTHTSKVSSNLTRCFQRARDRLSGTCLQSHCTPHRCAVSPHVNIMTLNNLLIPLNSTPHQSRHRGLLPTRLAVRARLQQQGVLDRSSLRAHVECDISDEQVHDYHARALNVHTLVSFSTLL